MKYKCAGIVLYNPNLSRLQENISAIYNQVEDIILVDNCSENISEILKNYSKDDKISIIKNETNKGIAAALNQLAYKAQIMGYDWILFLDQDSICCRNIIKSYSNYVYDEKIALICPYIIDINKMTLAEYENLDLAEISELVWAITSGSLVKINILIELGGFDEYLFIDEVDIEYSKRLKINGYLQLRINNVYMLQEVGNAEKLKIKRPHRDMASTLTWKPFYRTNHSLIRRYYMARNGIIVAKKYRKYESYTFNVLRVILMNFTRIIIEKNKREVIKSILKGLYDGLKYKIEPYYK